MPACMLPHVLPGKISSFPPPDFSPSREKELLITVAVVATAADALSPSFRVHSGKSLVDIIGILL